MLRIVSLAKKTDTLKESKVVTANDWRDVHTANSCRYTWPWGYYEYDYQWYWLRSRFQSNLRWFIRKYEHIGWNYCVGRWNSSLCWLLSHTEVDKEVHAPDYGSITENTDRSEKKPFKPRLRRTVPWTSKNFLWVRGRIHIESFGQNLWVLRYRPIIILWESLRWTIGREYQWSSSQLGIAKHTDELALSYDS